MPLRYAIPLVVSVSILTSPSDATAQSYTVYRLEPTVRNERVFDPLPVDMNNAMQIVAWRLLWDRSPQARSLPIPGLLRPTQINNSGVIAGSRELGPGRSELFTIENGSYIVRPVPLAHPGIVELTDSGRMLVYDETTATSWIVDGSHLEQLEEPTFLMNDAGVLATGKSLRFPSGRRLEPWPESWPIRALGGGGHVAGGGCDGAGCTVLYARPDGVTARYRFPGFHSVWFHVNRPGEVLVSVQAFFFFRQSINFVYRDGPIIDLNAAMRTKGWLLCETAGINDQGAILALATKFEPNSLHGTGCESLVLLYPDPPAAPRDFVATVSGRSVTLTWTSSADVRGHILEVGSAPGASNLLQIPLGEQPSLTTAAPPGRYYVRIRARNGVATGVPSSELIVDVR